MTFATTEYAGSDPTLWLIHPIGTRGTIWRPLIPALQERFRVVTVDLPGHGATPGWPAPFRLDAVAEHLAGQIAQDAHPAVVIGHSLGGMIGQCMAVAQPDWLRGLVLTSTMPGAGAAGEAMRQRAEVARQEGMGALLDPTLTRWFVTQSLRSPTPEVRRVAEMLAATDAEAHAATWEAMSQWSMVDRLARVRVPTLIVVGDHDVSTPPAVAQIMADAIPDNRLLVVPGVGHALPQEAPEVWTQAVLHFVQSLG